MERKECHLDFLTRPSLMPYVISHWEKNFCFLLWFLFTIFIFIDCFEVGTKDLMFLIEDLILLMMTVKTLSWQKVNLPWLRATLHAARMLDVVHVSLLHRKLEASVVSLRLVFKCHKLMICKMKQGLLVLQVMISIKSFVGYNWAT